MSVIRKKINKIQTSMLNDELHIEIIPIAQTNPKTRNQKIRKFRKLTKLNHDKLEIRPIKIEISIFKYIFH